MTRAGLVAAGVVLLTAMPAAGWQFDDRPVPGGQGFSFAEYPTLEGVVAAHHAGQPPTRIIRWILDNGAYIPLSLDDALQLKAQGIDTQVMATMVRVSGRQLAEFLEAQDEEFVVRGDERRGMSKRQIRNMIQEGATNEEIAQALARSGSRADFSIEEALDLWRQGVSPTTLTAAGRGLPPTGAEGAAAEPDEDVISLDEIPEGDEPMSLDAIFAGSGEDLEEEEPYDLDEIFDEEDLEDEDLPYIAGYEDDSAYDEAYPTFQEPFEQRGTEMIVVSERPGDRVEIAPGNIRPADLLRQAKGFGRTPARSDLSPGSYYVMVEKELDSFDESLIPAFRTVHDRTDLTRTLIESGILYFDVEECCLPKSLQGDFQISRISADQQGLIMGDTFGGLPPYLWDGNRYLVMQVEEGRVERIMKVYRTRKATGEGKMIVASFVPATWDFLSAGTTARAQSEMMPPDVGRMQWPSPDSRDVEGVGRIYGIPPAQVPRLLDRLRATGKATWSDTSSEGVLRVLSLSLDTYGRTRLEKANLKQSGPFSMYATYAPAEKAEGKEGKAAAESKGSLGPLQRAMEPSNGLPVLVVDNTTDSGALLQMGDGTVMYLPSGASRELTVSPGSSYLEARFADSPARSLKARAHFAYNSKYKLSL